MTCIPQNRTIPFGPPVAVGIILGLKYDWVVGLGSAFLLLVILIAIFQRIIKKRIQAARVDAPGGKDSDGN